MNNIVLKPVEYRVSLQTDSGVLELDAVGTFIRLAVAQVVELPGGGDKTYRHVQGTAANVWEVTHGLGKYPAVSVMDSGGTLVEGDVDYVNENNVILTFTAPFSGEANFN